MATQTWRFIPLLSATGAQQMAIDRWLLDQHYRGLHPPTLRFYTWSPIAISLGYHQRHWPPTWDTLTWQGQAVDRVRRPTGGRAVLHQGDLTYALITSAMGGDSPVGTLRDRCQAYRHLCEFLIRGWQTLSIDLHYGTAGGGYAQQTNCFGLATAADLVLADGTKFIGSAQLRRGQSLLQHGSIRLNPDPELYATVFGTSLGPAARSPQLMSGASLPQLAHLDLETIIAALAQAASDCFGVTLQPQPLSPAEWAMIEPTIASLEVG